MHVHGLSSPGEPPVLLFFKPCAWVGGNAIVCQRFCSGKSMAHLFLTTPLSHGFWLVLE